MKKTVLIAAFFLSLNVFAQDGFMMGVNISPAWKVNMTAQKQTGLRTYQSGYGFSIGVPFKYWINDYSAFSSGIDYDFGAFDGYNNGNLVSSVRFSAVHVPLMFNINLTGNWYALAGAGVLYNLAVRDLNYVGGSDVTGVSNQFQPYLGLGVSSIIERGSGFFEYGAKIRYQVRNIWNEDYPAIDGYNSRLISIDFVLQYFF